jgi:hypothetical protein
MKVLKRFWNTSSGLGMTETSPLGTVADYSHSMIIYQKMKIRYSCEAGCISSVELNCKAMMGPTDGKTMGELQIKEHGP